ncbi:MAG: hypothetical protein R2748_17865 [Bryobacterales bacterium]
MLVEVFERILRDAEARVEYHYVLMDYLCELEGGTLRAGDDAADAAWVPLSQLDELAMTRGTPAVIRKAHAMRAQVSP